MRWLRSARQWLGTSRYLYVLAPGQLRWKAQRDDPMIGLRTPQQLGLLERFHQTLKTEEVYWRIYTDPMHARDCLADFRARYNCFRPHWALRPEEGGDPLVPEEVYAQGRVVQLPRRQQWAKAAKEKLDEMMGAA
jgi:transposase InsO family protein